LAQRSRGGDSSNDPPTHGPHSHDQLPERIPIVSVIDKIAWIRLEDGAILSSLVAPCSQFGMHGDPIWHHRQREHEIAVRLPDDLVEFVDELVHGDAPSRAAVVARALRRERRQAAAARDAAILTRTEPDADLNRLAEHAATLPMDDLD
jgi:Arc/MetJ-type ribon-helix-helix transcriptional regulator